VLCRLSRPYRVTTDLDPVSRLQHGQTGQLPLLVAAGATLSGPSGVRLPTGLGPVQIDVLQVSDPDFDPPSVDALVAQPVAAGLQQAGQHLKDDALLHVARWFKQGRDRTLKRIRSIPEGATTTQDDLELVAEQLTTALTRRTCAKPRLGLPATTEPVPSEGGSRFDEHSHIIAVSPCSALEVCELRVEPSGCRLDVGDHVETGCGFGIGGWPVRCDGAGAGERVGTSEGEQSFGCHGHEIDPRLVGGPQQLQVHQVVCSFASGLGACVDLLRDLVVRGQDGHRLRAGQAQCGEHVGDLVWQKRVGGAV
jgi:hypothetical protein